MCANRVMFKQFLQSGGMQYCQIDSARIGGVNEILAVYLMAEKLKGNVTTAALLTSGPSTNYNAT